MNLEDEFSYTSHDLQSNSSAVSAPGRPHGGVHSHVNAAAQSETFNVSSCLHFHNNNIHYTSQTRANNNKALEFITLFLYMTRITLFFINL